MFLSGCRRLPMRSMLAQATSGPERPFALWHGRTPSVGRRLVRSGAPASLAVDPTPRYVGYHVSGRTKKVDVLVNPDAAGLGHVTHQHWQERSEWVTASWPSYEAIIDETIWVALRGSSRGTPAPTPVHPAAEVSCAQGIAIVDYEAALQATHGPTGHRPAFLRRRSAPYTANTRPTSATQKASRSSLVERAGRRCSLTAILKKPPPSCWARGSR